MVPVDASWNAMIIYIYFLFIDFIVLPFSKN